MATEVEAGGEEVLFKKRGPKKVARKRPATPPPASDSDDSEDYSSQDEQGQRQVKRRKKNTGAVTATSELARSRAAPETTSTFSGDRSRTIQDSNDATKQSNWIESDVHASMSTAQLLGSTRNKVPPPEAPNPLRVGTAAAPEEAIYKGQSNYSTFVDKNPDAPSNKIGPTKAAPSNVRMTNYTDFAPDVCKDYKQTGFCGFGDSCKFLHAREDYKAGWQLDSEWDKFAAGKKEISGKVVSSRTAVDKEDEEDGLTKEDIELLEKIPFKCIICKEDYKMPIVTKCGHYYCEACALKRFRKTPACAACGAGTGGVFNQAKGLKKLLEKKEKRDKRLKEKEEQEKVENNT